MAKIKFSAEFEEHSWRPVSIETTMPDKFAWKIFRQIAPKPKDIKEALPEKQPEQ